MKHFEKKTIARFTDRKVVKDALYNRKKLKAIDKAALEMEKAMRFLNENCFSVKKTEASRNYCKYLLGK